MCQASSQVRHRVEVAEQVLCLAALLCIFAASGLAQLLEPGISVNGSPLITSRPATRIGDEWFLPLRPIARALGVDMEITADGQMLRVRRRDGAEVVYDSRTGEIRNRYILVGQVRNFQQVQLIGVNDDLLFPLTGVVALLGVDVQEDIEHNVLRIELSSGEGAEGQPPGGGFFNLAGLEYRYGLTTNGKQHAQFADLRGEGLAGSARIKGHLLLSATSGRSPLGFTQGALHAELPGDRTVFLGDQATSSGLDALTSTVRGVGYGQMFKGFKSHFYGGRGIGTTFASVGPGFARYDTNLVGFGLQRKLQRGELSIAGNYFNSADRDGTSAGVGYSRFSAKNQFKAQGLVGQFSGLSSRSVPVRSDEALPFLGFEEQSPVVQSGLVYSGFMMVDGGGRPVVIREQTTRARVHGPAFGFSLADSFTPFKQLTVTGQFERYGKNFITAREDSRFNAQSSRAVSITLRPSTYLSLNGGVTDRNFLLGGSDRSRNYNYGANASLPGRVPLQFGFFKTIEIDAASRIGRFAMTQYSLGAPRLKTHSAYTYFSLIRFGDERIRILSTVLTADYGRHGRVGAHSQSQFGSNHRYGADWYLEMPKTNGYIRVGLDRVTSRHGSSGYSPVAGIRLPLPHGQSLQITYRGERDTHLFQFELGGNIVRDRELVRNSRGLPSVVVPAPVVGRVYFDVDSNGTFNSTVDKALADVVVRLDNGKSVTTNADGFFRFDQVSPGAHAVRADLTAVPADLVFAEVPERTIAITPYRDNVQNFRVVRTGRIVGKVTYLDYSDPEKPVERGLPDARIIASSDHDTFSEVNGNFLLGDVPPGSYELRLDPATLPGRYTPKRASITAVVKPGETVNDVRFQLIIPPKPVIEKRLPRQGVESPHNPGGEPPPPPRDKDSASL